MPDKKLTDSEIKKALKGLLELVLVEGCLQRAKTISNTLDLINRLQEEKEALINGQETLQKYIAEQKTEIEKLQKFKAYFDFYYGCDIEILGIDENGDTTSFDEFYNCAIANAESIEHHIAHIIKTAKAEAYKEFAEISIEKIEKARQKYQRLCKEQGEEMEEHMHIHFNGIVGIINNLLKELAGD